MWWSFIETESGGEVLVCLLIQLQLLIGGGGGGRGGGMVAPNNFFSVSVTRTVSTVL